MDAEDRFRRVWRLKFGRGWETRRGDGRSSVSRKEASVLLQAGSGVLGCGRDRGNWGESLMGGGRVSEVDDGS